MRRRLPPPNWLRSFEAAARHLSFTHAAQELNVSQSAVSQQVKLLEHFLKQPLFRRFPRRLELTDAGKAYLPTVREAFARLAATTEELFGTGQENVVTIKVNVSFAMLWLAPRLGQFMVQYPQFSLRVVNTIWLDELGWEGIDLDIRVGKGGWPNLQVIRLAEDALFPLCAPQLKLQKPADLAPYTLLTPMGNEDSWPQWFAYAGVADFSAGRSVQLDAAAVAYEIAASGAGVVLGRRILTQDLLQAGHLVKPFDIELPTEETYYLVWPENRTESAGALAFREWLVCQLG